MVARQSGNRLKSEGSMTEILKEHWKLLLAALAAPAVVMLCANKLKAQTVTVKRSPYANLRAFLIMIQYAEGTYGPNAYRTLFGGQLFDSYAQHPHLAVTKGGLTSTAAGAYQILYRTWMALSDLRLPDFSPASQDRAAIELIRRRGALEDVMTGRLSEAIYKCRKEWASLPDAGYGQHERTLESLALAYRYAGGEIAV